MVEPGPNFSVADVHRGWRNALSREHAVVNYNLADRLTFYSEAHMEAPDGEWIRSVDNETAVRLAMQGVEAAAMRWWPEVVIFTSAFYVSPDQLDLFRSRGMKVVVLHTESPYEDDRQLKVAPHADLNVLNDPTNLDTFEVVSRAVYLPHSYDPDVHSPGPAVADLKSDVCFVGTGYPSRIEFLEAVDWSGLDVILAGNWQALDDDSPLAPFVLHDREACWANEEAVDLYRSAKLTFNLYRSEANLPSLSDGWSLGPREVEVAAVGTMCLRQPRGEGDEVFPMLPTFTTPDELGELCRWWATHDNERTEAAAAAREAVAGWTFDRRAEQLLELLGA